MSESSTEQIRELLDSLNRADSGRILATLIRLLGDLDLAEEAMHEAFAAALSLWPSRNHRKQGENSCQSIWLLTTSPTTSTRPPVTDAMIEEIHGLNREMVQL